MDRINELLAAALAVGVVDSKDEFPAMLSREQEVVERCPNIADVETARRRRREPSDDRHFGSPV